MQTQEHCELTGRRRELLDALPALRRFAFSLAGNADAAGDLLQRTVARVMRLEIPVDADLVSWCIRACRQARMEERAGGGDSAASRAVRSARATSEAAGGGEVQAALAALTDEQRAVLELVTVEGRSYGAAAAMLDLPIGQVMSRLVRARGALIEQCRSESRAAPEPWAVNHG